jgi:hypothetical protein
MKCILKRTECKNTYQINLVQDRHQWWNPVKTINGPPGTIILGEFLDCLVFQKGLCFLELVNHLSMLSSCHVMRQCADYKLGSISD